MSQVDELLREYKEAHQAGAGDPRPFLSRAPAEDRAVLAALIDGYLEQAPRQELSRDEMAESAAAPVVEGIHRSLTGAGGLWPALLPRLRAQARVKRADLVRELAARLGAQSQQDKVAGYYHQMEQGLLPADGVSDTRARLAGEDRGGGGRVAAQGGVAARAGAAADGRGGGVHADHAGLDRHPSRQRSRGRPGGGGGVGRGRPPVPRPLSRPSPAYDRGDEAEG